MKKIAVAVLAAVALMATGCAKKTTVVINNADDLVGKKVGVQAGTTGEIYASDIEDVKISSFKSGIDAGLALSAGTIDAIVLDELPAKEIVKRSPKLKILDQEFSLEDYAIAVRKGEPELLNSINASIRKMKTDGTYDMLQKAFMPAEGEIVIPVIKETAPDGNILKMGTEASFPPFEYTEGTKVVGFDVSQSQVIANDAGRKLQVVAMAFDSLIAALQSGAVDFIAAGMTVTEERMLEVDFSEPYYQSKQVIIVRK
ncbi:MAG: transporter substrate-binding domain-containing protein [Treponema sp.]|nr:transporter substrate-binding domain-containing protein [Treponema sp.]